MKEKKLKSRRQITVKVMNPLNTEQAKNKIDELSETLKRIYGGITNEI